MVDLHAHLLPSVDDGPADLADAIALCDALASQGVKVASATPHLPNPSGLGLEALGERHEVLTEGLREAGIALRVVLSAELTMSAALELDSPTMAAFAFGQRFVLVEPPLVGDWNFVAACHRRLGSFGLGMLLAHAERFPPLAEGTDDLEALIEAGMLVQVSASAISGHAAQSQSLVADDLVSRGLAHCISTDAHGTTRRRPRLREARDAVASRYDPSLATWLTSRAPRAILEGAHPGPAPSTGAPPAPKKNWLRNWRLR